MSSPRPSLGFVYYLCDRISIEVPKVPLKVVGISPPTATRSSKELLPSVAVGFGKSARFSLLYKKVVLSTENSTFSAFKKRDRVFSSTVLFLLQLLLLWPASPPFLLTRCSVNRKL
ncbi:hypothetical protein ABFS82_09G029800 [Erythranthe guttata]